MLPSRCLSFHFGTSASNLGILCYLQMVQVDIPQSLLEEEGRQMYGTKLLEIQVSITVPFSLRNSDLCDYGKEDFHLNLLITERSIKIDLENRFRVG